MSLEIRLNLLEKQKICVSGGGWGEEYFSVDNNCTGDCSIASRCLLGVSLKGFPTAQRCGGAQFHRKERCASLLSNLSEAERPLPVTKSRCGDT